MNKVIVLASILFLLNPLIIFLNITSPSNPIDSNINFDILYEDPIGDVETQNGSNVLGHDNIDIIQIKSYTSKDKRNLIIEIIVVGKIKNSPNIEYNIELFGNFDYEGNTEDELFYSICYKNSYFEGDSQLNANIIDNILEITISLEEIKKDFKNYIDGFDIYVHSQKDKIYSDYCSGFNWGNPILITEPYDGSTVTENCSISGNISHLENSFKTIEIQIDSQSLSGWKLTSTINNWSTWSYHWNTVPELEGEHKIYARAFNGSNYFFDRIILNVKHQREIDPIICKAPSFNIGDYNLYTGGFPGIDYPNPNDNTILPPFYFFDANFGVKITGIDNITINSIEYDVYTLEWTFDSNVKFWIRRSDLAIIKGELEIPHYNEENEKMFDGIEMIYEYPYGYERYPFKVNKKWENIVFEKHRYYNVTNKGKTEIRNFTHIYSINYECLSSNIIDVPAGTFNVFKIRTYINYYNNYSNEILFEEITDEKQWNHKEYFIEYYSPEIGNIVKFETYFGGRNPDLSLELSSFKYGTKSYDKLIDEQQKKQYNINLKSLTYSFAITNSLVITIFLVMSTEIGKFGFYSAMVPLYSKRKKRSNYEVGFIKGSVRGVIYANPGENYSSIKKILGLPNGTLTYYLKSLEKEGIIKSERDGFLKRFYPLGFVIKKEKFELTEIQEDILNIIKSTPGIHQKNILSQLGISQQKLNYHIQLMVKARIIKVDHEGKMTRCYFLDDSHLFEQRE